MAYIKATNDFVGTNGKDCFVATSTGGTVDAAGLTVDGRGGDDIMTFKTDAAVNVGYGDLDGIERVQGGSGDDRLYADGPDGAMILANGWAGDDVIFNARAINGGAGNDTLTAGIETRSMVGGEGDDNLIGYGARQGAWLSGGDGADVLQGTKFLGETVWLNGGEGADTFAFAFVGETGMEDEPYGREMTSGTVSSFDAGDTFVFADDGGDYDGPDLDLRAESEAQVYDTNGDGVLSLGDHNVSVRAVATASGAEVESLVVKMGGTPYEAVILGQTELSTDNILLG